MRTSLGLLFAILLSGAAARTSAQSATVSVPRWLDPPNLDGRCDDAAYQRSESLALKGAGAVTQVAVLHSSLDLYVCVAAAGDGVERMAVRVDADRAGAGLVASGDYVFFIDNKGKTWAEQGSGGKLVPMKVTSTAIACPK